MSGLLWVVSMQLSRMIECSTHLFQSLRDQMMWNKLTLLLFQSWIVETHLPKLVCLTRLVAVDSVLCVW